MRFELRVSIIATLPRGYTRLFYTEPAPIGFEGWRHGEIRWLWEGGWTK